MVCRNRFIIAVALFACAGVSVWPAPVWADLESYIRKPEPAFGWKQNGKTSREPAGDQIYDLHFVSQTWQGKNWQHQLQVYRPQSVAPAAMMLLWVTGGSATPDKLPSAWSWLARVKLP